jgi:hypothetical protein
MLGRYLKWSTPQGGVAFLVDIDALIKAHQEFWRPFDRCFANALLSLTQYASHTERIEVWGGLFQNGAETNYLLLLAGSALPSEVVSFFYGQLRQHLPEGAILFVGSPSVLPSVLPVYAITEGTVYRVAVTEDGTTPTLRVVLKSPEGPMVGQIPAVPVNLAAMLDKVAGVSLLIADLSNETGGGGFTEEGDKLASENGEQPEAPQPPNDDKLGATEAISPVEESSQSIESLSGSLRVMDADVVFIEEVVPHPSEEPAEEVSQTYVAEPPYSDVIAKEPQPSADANEIPTMIRPAASPEKSAGTLIDIGDDDIASAKVVNGTALNAITDSELRLILTSAPLEETCQKLAAALQKQPADIARVYALASGATAVPGPESAFALRARTVASVVGWVLAPRS